MIKECVDENGVECFLNIKTGKVFYEKSELKTPKITVAPEEATTKDPAVEEFEKALLESPETVREILEENEAASLDSAMHQAKLLKEVCRRFKIRSLSGKPGSGIRLLKDAAKKFGVSVGSKKAGMGGPSYFWYPSIKKAINVIPKQVLSF